MAVYAIGDVQGCQRELMTLLSLLEFNPDTDRLWFVGDLVNRGPDSLEVLRFVKSLGDRAVTVLGNHDLHLLAIATGTREPGPGDTFGDILAAPDRAELIDWLRRLPLLHQDAALGYTMIHAGLPPQWDLAQAAARAAEVEAVLSSDDYVAFLRDMYGGKPDRWSEDLRGTDRLRFILNCYTRLRFCDVQGRIHLKEKGSPFGRDDGLKPWFDIPGRASADLNLVFGHWSTLGRYHAPGVCALDSGCVWGGALTALRLDGEPQWISLPCAGYCRPGEE
ncbi:MAG: symmetrical bis(5'-nucleosyl)-tetraphosphatase [Gammaproteobacteria bacterium]|nr:symmetrical bis(5'-nucleosyl)-tetraphosphatase [Gammaproteobacteria bacterium]